MTDKITVLSAIAYDDMRAEVGGGMSFMGVAADGQFEFPVFPARIRLGISLICNINQVGEATLFPKLRYNGEIKWAAEVDVELDALSTGVVLPVCHTFASFEESGELELLLSIDDDSDEKIFSVKTWKTLHFSDDE